MAEMAYNLYPRDIMFLNIIGMSNVEVLNKIENITIETHTGKSGSEKSAVKIKNYGYIIFLSASDIIYSEKLQFMANYRKTGGYIYMLNSG